MSLTAHNIKSDKSTNIHQHKILFWIFIIPCHKPQKTISKRHIDGGIAPGLEQLQKCKTFVGDDSQKSWRMGTKNITLRRNMEYVGNLNQEVTCNNICHFNDRCF
jgi:hypothetical protein